MLRGPEEQGDQPQVILVGRIYWIRRRLLSFSCRKLDIFLQKTHVVFMKNRLILVEGSESFEQEASDLLLAAERKPVREAAPSLDLDAVLHEIKLPDSRRVPLEETLNRIHAMAAKVSSHHRAYQFVYCLPGLSPEKYIKVVCLAPELEFTNSASEGVARILRLVGCEVSRVGVAPALSEHGSFVLDKVPGIESLGDDLRDDKTGRLDAKKVGQLFDISIPAIAKAAGITRQALDENPVSPKAQPVLKLFERVARLRSNPQFAKPAQLRKWFRQPLRIFGNHSAEDLFNAGELEVAAAKVDQLLTGDFGG